MFIHYMNVKLYILLLLSSFPIGDSLAIDKEKRDEIFKNYQSRPPIEGVHIYGSSEQLKFIAYVTDGNIIKKKPSENWEKFPVDSLSNIDPQKIKEMEIVKLQNNEAILFIRTKKRGKKLKNQIPITLDKLGIN